MPLKPDNIAQWIREEHAKVEELMQRLRERSQPAPRIVKDEWIRELRDRFEHLRAHLHKHMAFEEADGYLLQVLDLRPTLSDQVERLRREHRQLLRILDSIHALLEGLQRDDQLIIRDVCARIRDLLEYLEQHENQENMIVTHAFTQDLGDTG